MRPSELNPCSRSAYAAAQMLNINPKHIHQKGLNADRPPNYET